MSEADPIKREEEIREQCSMDYWWPRLRDVDVYTPETVSLEMEPYRWVMGELPNGEEDYLNVKRADVDEIIDAIHRVGGPPAFIRTDQASAKHHMVEASHVPNNNRETVKSRQFRLIEENEMAGMFGLPYKSLYVREWLNLWHEFKSFVKSGTPIASEVRVFLLDGDVHSYGFYWPEDAIWEHSVTEDNWRELHQHAYDMAMDPTRIKAVKKYARRVGEEFGEGYWSVDFALTESDQWYCIDMARGELSCHPEGCEKPESMKRLGEASS